MDNTLNFNISQIHLIPFDIGYMPLCPIEFNNSESLSFISNFIKILKTRSKKLNIEIISNISISDRRKFWEYEYIDYKYIDNSIADNVICQAIITDILHCYILANGIGIFVYFDSEHKALNDLESDLIGQNKVLIAGIQKKLSQSMLLGKYNGNNLLNDVRSKMLEFAETCWNVASYVAITNQTKNSRPFSSRSTYKSRGLSYVLTIYVVPSNYLTSNELDYLLFCPMQSNIVNKENWNTANHLIMNHKVGSPSDRHIIKHENTEYYFSWSAVAIVTPKCPKTFSDLINQNEINRLLRTEFYVQSYWFVADCSTDNAIKNPKCTLETLQIIENSLNFFQAEIKNRISANMNSLDKLILEKCIETSNIEQLYLSGITQISNQRCRKEIFAQKKNKKRKLVADCFLAIFTASSFFETFITISQSTISNFYYIIWVAILIICIISIVQNYKNE